MYLVCGRCLNNACGMCERVGVKTAEMARQAIVIDDTHYGRTEDAQMGICHMICYAFIENPELGR